MAGTWIASTCFTDFESLPGIRFKKKKCVCIYTHRHAVHCKGTSVSLDPFMLSADPNPKSMSKTQVKGKECVWVSVMK